SDVEELDKCLECNQPLLDEEELGFISCCMAKGLEHEFHLKCLVLKCNLIGPRCPTCGEESKCIITNAGHEINYDDSTKSFPLEEHLFEDDDEDVIIQIGQCASCLEPIFANDWYGRPAICEFADHIFHIECLAHAYMDYGPECPWCKTKSKLILEDCYGGLYFRCKTRMFYSKDIHTGKLDFVM
ncbi:hypothetical protein B4U80_12306, partial [Leptotrombidium deliense]